MTDSTLNSPAETDIKDHPGGAILLVKIGTHPKLTAIIPRLQQLLPQTKLCGIAVPGTPVAEDLEVVANEDQLLLGAFDDWWQRQLFVDPDLYSKVLPYEGQLLRMTQRVIDHDVFSIKKPNFPTEKDFKSFEGRRQLLLRQVAFWDFVLRHHKISAVVSQNLPHNFWDAVLHIVAQAREVPYLCFHEVRPFLGSLYMYRHPSDMGNLEFGRSLIELTRRKTGLMESPPSRREWMLRQVGLEDLQRTRESGIKSRTSLRTKLTGLASDRRVILSRIFRSTRRRIHVRNSRRETNDLFVSGAVPNRYFLIELQPPSNATSLTKGFMYGDARELIAHIAHNLPIGYSLVVKESAREHMQRLPRSGSFWRQVSALPSVVLVRPDANMHVLLKDSAGLIEVGYSTLVLQALHSGTPVAVVGHSHLPNLPGLHRVTTEDDLGNVLQALINSRQTRSSLSKGLSDSLSKWCDETQASTLEGALSSFPKDLTDFGEYQERVVSNSASLIATWYSQSVVGERSI